MSDKPKRSLMFSLISGIIVLGILFGTRSFWSGQGMGYLVGIAVAAAIMAEYATTKILKLISSKDEKEE